MTHKKPSKPSSSSHQPPPEVAKPATTITTPFDIWHDENFANYKKKRGHCMDSSALSEVMRQEFSRFSSQQQAPYVRRAQRIEAGFRIFYDKKLARYAREYDYESSDERLLAKMKAEWKKLSVAKREQYSQQADKQGKKPEDPSSISLFDSEPTPSPPTPQTSGTLERLQNPRPAPRSPKNPASPQTLDPESKNHAWLIWYREKLPFYQQTRRKSSQNEIQEEMRNDWSDMPESQKAPYYREVVKTWMVNPEDVDRYLEPFVSENQNPTSTTTPNPIPKNPTKPRGILRSKNPTKATERRENLQEKMMAKKPSESATPTSSRNLKSPGNQKHTRFSFMTVKKVHSIKPRAHLSPMTIPDLMTTSLAKSSGSKRDSEFERGVDPQLKKTNQPAVHHEKSSEARWSPEPEFENLESMYDTTPEPVIAEGVRLVQRLTEPQTPPRVPQHHDLTPLVFPNQPKIKEPFSEFEHIDFQLEFNDEIEPTLPLTDGYPLEAVLEDLSAKTFTKIGLNF